MVCLWGHPRQEASEASLENSRDGPGGVEVVGFTPSPKDGERTPNIPDEHLMDINTDSDDDPLVIPVTILVELVVPSPGHKENLVALLDLGCTRCLINPALVEKLGLRLKQLKVPMAFFCQLDSSVAGGRAAMFITEPIEIRETLSFIMAPGMERRLY